MRFMIIRKADQETEAGVMPSAELLQAMARYNEELLAAGVMLDGAGLEPSSAGTRVRRSGGAFSVTDGPFAETKELVSGFSIWKVGSKVEALERLAKWPAQDAHGAARLEVRQLYEASDFGDPGEAPPPPVFERKPGTPRFMLLLKANAFTESGDITEGHGETFAAMDALIGEAVASGAYLGGEGLKPSRMGARVAFSRGKPTITDGPFTETKELVAGYVVLQGARDDAIAFAKRWLEVHVDGLGLGEGEIEIRTFYVA